MMTEDSLIEALRRAGEVRAPASLLGGVLDAVGIAARFAPVDTDIGVIWIAWTPQGVRAAMRDVTADEFARWYAERFGVAPVRVEALPDPLRRSVASLLVGEGGGGAASRVRFDLRGLTPFEQDVLQTALRIPRGEVRPYSWVARRIGRPLAVRAVGTALAHNPIPYLIPCHRVVRADGHIGNYGGGGPVAKRAILGWEGVDAAELERLARRGVRYTGSDTTHIFCYPTCRHARRTTEQHRVTFGSADAAHRAGYRACKVCTPAAVAA
jgi:O-6-methylguanine DNA methyltransferase